jgi:hypothetical protein
MAKKAKSTTKTEPSRHISKNVSEALQKKHFFECAWCGTALTEQHHIEHYALGGAHTVDNLILLCPNCHTQVHQGTISTTELRQRKSTHLEGDRIGGNVVFYLERPDFKVGGNRFINTPRILIYRGNPLFDWKRKNNGKIMLEVRLHDSNGNLIFWMSDNRYWAPSDFRATATKTELNINCSDSPFFNLRVYKLDSIISIEGLCFIGGMGLLINPNYIATGNHRFLMGNSTFNNCDWGIELS